MKRMFVLGVLILGITTFGLAKVGNNQGQNGNGQGGNGNGQGNGGPVQMPEGPAFELPLFLAAAASWGLWRHYSRNPKRLDSDQA
jgi:hypothetical protein